MFETEARRIITTMNNDSEVLFMISTAKLKCSILVGSDVVYNSYLCSRVESFFRRNDPVVNIF